MSGASVRTSLAAAGGLPLGSLRVLYVTDRTDAPFRYRCLHPVLLLRSEGIRADIRHLSEISAVDASSYSTIVLFRLPWSEKVRSFVELARAHGAVIVFDIDDLIFDHENIRQLPFWNSISRGDQNRYLELSERYERTFHEADYFLGATAALAEAARKKGKIAAEHPNLLHPYLKRISKMVSVLRRSYASSPLISYMSGSSTHDLDFMTVAPAIRRVLEKHPESRLLICGFLDLRRLFGIHDKRIVRLPFIDWKVLPWIQSLAWVNLAPLSRIDAFTESKSALKFFEAGIVGVPTVASPSQPLREAISHGVNGFLAANSREWVDSVSACLSLGESRRVGEAARQTSLDRYSIPTAQGALSQWLCSIARSDWHPKTTVGRSRYLDPETVDPELRKNGGRAWQRLARLRAIAGVIAKAGTPEKIAPIDGTVAAAEHWTAVDSVPDFVTSDPRLNGCDIPAPDSTLGKTDACGWEIAWEAESSPDDPGGYRSFGTDPCLLSPALELNGADYRFLLIEMSATVEGGSSTGQLYWLTDERPTYGETRSCPFPVIADGRKHSYVIDLQRTVTGASDATSWSESKDIRRIRFDPLRHPGEFHIFRMRLLSESLISDAELWQLAGLRPVREELAASYLAGEGVQVGEGPNRHIRPMTAEFLEPPGADPLAAGPFDFCVIDSRNESEALLLLPRAVASLRREGVLFAMWDRGSPEKGFATDIPAKVLEWIVQRSGDRSQCTLVLRR